MTEAQVAEVLHAERKRLKLGVAWDEPYCPTVNAGPDSAAGHSAPGQFKVKRGQLVHVDFGVKREDYCSDLQRMWYVLDKGETHAPEDVRRAWDAGWAALNAGAAQLKPGVAGWEVDAAARETLIRAGYPEYQHSLGHQLGRVAHDGSTLLGPRWDRYGQSPFGLVEVGNVFTLDDDGGVANGGQNTDQTPNTMTVNVTSVYDSPAGTDATLTMDENTSYTFSVAHFGFTDPNDSPANAFQSVVITTLPAAGTLTLAAGCQCSGCRNCRTGYHYCRYPVPDIYASAEWLWQWIFKLHLPGTR